MNLNPSEVILGQGTLRPDLIESASGLASEKADVIKTHHNDTDLVRKLRAEGRVVEPLKDFHKDEVGPLKRSHLRKYHAFVRVLCDKWCISIVRYRKWRRCVTCLTRRVSNIH